MSILDAPRQWNHRTWVLAGCLAFAAVYLVLGLVRHDLALVIGGPVIMLGYGAFLLLFGGRSEAIGLLAGDRSDERRQLIQLRATAATGNALVLALVAGGLVTIGLGSSYFAVFGALCAFGGISFVAATAWYSRRT